MKKKVKNSKRKAVVLLSIIWAVVLFLCVFSVVPLTFGADGISVYTPPLSSISLGVDLKGGVSAVYEGKRNIEEEDGTLTPVENFDAKLSQSIEIMKARLKAYNYRDASVTREGQYSIRVEIPDVDNSATIFETIGKPAKIEFCEANTSDSAKKGPVVVTGENITTAEALSSNNTYAVSVQLDSAGTQTFSEITKKCVDRGESLYIWIDDQMFTTMSVSEQIKNGKVLISGEFTEDSASGLALQLNSGALQLGFEAPVIRSVSPMLGESAIKAGLIAGGIGIVLFIIFMFAFYRYFGIAGGLSLLIYTFLYVIVLATLPWVKLTLPGIAGIIISYAFAVDGNIMMFERIKEEYKSGKSLIAACDAGYKKSLFTILDSHAVALIASVGLWILGWTSVSGFAVTLFAGVLLSALCSLVFTRFFIKKLIDIDSNSASKYNLKREVNEIE